MKVEITKEEGCVIEVEEKDTFQSIMNYLREENISDFALVSVDGSVIYCGSMWEYEEKYREELNDI